MSTNEQPLTSSRNNGNNLVSGSFSAKEVDWYKVKRNWNWCKISFFVGLSFWLIETIIFLFIYGWHWKAVTEDEKICDTIASSFWSVTLVLFGLVLIEIVEYLLRDIRSND